MTRKAITLATKVAVLQSQALCGCGCGEKLGEDIIWDHVLAHALEGSDGPENIRAVRVDCDKIITNGTKATTAGSTKHVVAKVRRLAKKAAPEKYASERLSRLSIQKHKRKILSLKFPPRPDGYEYRWPKGRKVQG